VNGAWSDALAFAAEARRILKPGAITFLPVAGPPDENVLSASSWWLAGFATLCDWVGSNAEWFPFQPETKDLAGYWQIAQGRARDAVRAAGFAAPVPRSFKGFHALFEAIREPSPLQRCANSLSLGEGPQFFLIEDLTGSGKTEAAMALVARLLDAGKADGFFFRTADDGHLQRDVQPNRTPHRPPL